MQVRCPQCHTPIDLASDGELSDIACPSCGSSFSLLGSEETAPLDHEQVKTIGHFELTEQIGVGTFGSVWRARDVDLDRTVAVKIPRKGQLDPQETEQFLREARAAAQLRHPGIVSVHEVGREGDTVFIVSDLVEGVTLADRLTAQPFSSREAAELCAKVADALQHAHDAGVIHRDLKTGNIMLDAEGEPHILDFGLARREAGEVTMTVEGRVLGTPAYLSPEQAQGEAHTADGRTDVYSLGVILFELLTGERPFRGNIRMLIHQVIHEEAPSPRRLSSSVPRDLETICLKCLEKDPEKRYQTAGDLGQDLKRYLVGEPIEARPVSRWERGWRWCKRNPVVAGLTGTVAALVLTGLVVTASLLILANIEAEQRRRQLYVADMNVAWMAWEDSNPERAIELLKQHVPRGGEEDHRSFDWYCLWELLNRDVEACREISLPDIGIGIAFSPKGDLLATSHPRGGTRDTTITVWDVATGQMISEMGKSDPVLWQRIEFGFLADGMTLAYLDTEQNVVIQAMGSEETRKIDSAAKTVCLVISPANGNLITADDTGRFTAWDSLVNREIASFGGTADGIAALDISADGKVLAVGHADGSIRVWDMTTGTVKHVIQGHTKGVLSVAISRNGATIATGSLDNTARIWNAKTGKIESEIGVHVDDIRDVTFSPDDKVLATLSRDQTVRLWEIGSYREIETLRGGACTRGIAFSPDGTALAVTGEENVIKLWDVQRLQPSITLLPDEPGSVLALSDDGELLASTSNFDLSCHTVTVWSPSTSTEPRLFSSTMGFILCTDLNKARGLVAGGGKNGVQLWDLGTGDFITALTAANRMFESVAISPDGELLAAGTQSGEVMIWALKTRKVLNEIRAHDRIVRSLAFSPNGSLLASGSWDRTAKLWNAHTGELVRELPQHPDIVLDVTFSGSATLFATGCFDSKIRIWDLSHYTDEPEVLEGHALSADNIEFSADSKVLISTSGDRTIRVWDLATGQQRCLLGKHTSRVFGAALSTDGRTLATGGNDVIRIWRAATPSEVEASQWWRDVMAKGR